jgi:type I restriction enzyme S subunit
MEKYKSYKPSGIEWIGQVPSSWKISKFKYVSKLYTGNSLNDEQKILFESENENDIPYVSSKDIDLNTQTVNYNNGLRIPRDKNLFKVSPKDSFLLCVEGGSSGRKMVYLDREVCFVNKLCSFRSIENTRFQYYFIQSSNFQDKFKLSLSGLIGGVSISNLRDFELVLPNIQEQNQIVQFLDEKTELIDKLIYLKEKKISILKEQRISLINQVITKGLFSDVKMKDSGVEWIGEIPESWVKSRLDFLCDLKGRVGWKSLKSDEYVDKGYIFLSTPNIKNKEIDYENVNYITEERYLESPEIMLKNGDVLLVKDGSTLGIVNIVKNLPSPTTVNSSIGVLKNKSTKLIPEFLFYFLSSHYCQNIIDRMKGGMGVPHLFQSDIKKFEIFLPTILEQNQIVEFLDSKTIEIDDLMDLEQKKIDLLKEYRQSLISEVVTGKIKVTTDE